MDKQMEPRQRPLATPTTTDDESITTSTASDTLDSWTLVTDKKNLKTTTPIYEDENNVEDLPKYEDLELETSQSTAKEEQETEPSPEHHADTTSATDEFSDEVSIISESESGDVLAPRPYLREHLQTLNLKFTTGQGLDLASLLQQQQQEEHRLQQRHEYEQEQTTPPNTPIQLTQRSNSNGSSYQARQRKRRSPSVDITQKTLKTQSSAQVPCTLQQPYFIRRVYTLFFYSIVAMIVLGFYGKLGFGEWGIFRSDSTSINTLEKKLMDMELQNNLMRAEIDILSRQIHYLKTINSPQNGDKNDKKYQSNNENEEYPKKEEKFDGRKLYYRMQAEYNLNERLKNIAEEIPNTVEPTEATNNIASDVNEATPEPIIRVIETPESLPDQPKNDENTQAPPPKYYGNDDHILRERFNKHNGKDRRDFASKNEENFRKRDERAENFKRQNKQHTSKEQYSNNDSDGPKNAKRDSKERYNEKNNSKERKYKRENDEHKPNNNDDSKERRYKREDRDNSKERHYKKENNEHDSNNNDNSKERKYNREDNSKERKYKRENNAHKRNNNHESKEYYHENQQQKHRRPHSGERFENEKPTGEWHEKLMQHREKARNEHEQRLKREKNWYLNRNDGREQWRSEEMNRR